MRTCDRCGDPIPDGSRKDRRWCSGRCAVAAFRSRVVSAPTSDVSEPQRRSKPLQGPLVCSCGRAIGELVDGTVRLARGRWTGGEGLYWWHANVDFAEITASTPVRIVCPGCRAEVAA